MYKYRKRDIRYGLLIKEFFFVFSFVLMWTGDKKIPTNVRNKWIQYEMAKEEKKTNK